MRSKSNERIPCACKQQHTAWLLRPTAAVGVPVSRHKQHMNVCAEFGSDYNPVKGLSAGYRRRAST